MKSIAWSFPMANNAVIQILGKPFENWEKYWKYRFSGQPKPYAVSWDHFSESARSCWDYYTWRDHNNNFPAIIRFNRWIIHGLNCHCEENVNPKKQSFLIWQKIASPLQDNNNDRLSLFQYFELRIYQRFLLQGRFILNAQNESVYAKTGIHQAAFRHYGFQYPSINTFLTLFPISILYTKEAAIRIMKKMICCLIWKAGFIFVLLRKKTKDKLVK